MNIQQAIAEQNANKKALTASLGKITEKAPRKKVKSYSERQHEVAIDQAVNEALEAAAELVWAKVGIGLGRRREADNAMLYIRSLKRS